MATGMTELSDEQVVQKLQTAEVELVRTRFQHSLGQLENTATMRVHRRTIARCLTELRARETTRGLPKNALLGSASEGAEVADAAAAPATGGNFLSGIVDKLTQNS